MNDRNETLASNLRDLRSWNKLTLEQVAERIGVHESTVSRAVKAERIGVTRQAVAKWESGERAPDLNNCAALAELYHVTLDDLVRHDRAKTGVGVPPKGKHMFGLVTVGERGQIVIPKRAREIFGIRPGDQLMLLGDEGRENRGLALVDPKVFLANVEALERAFRRKGGEEA